MNELLDKLGNTPLPESEQLDHCSLCDSTKSELLYDAFDRLHHLPGRFGIVRCAECSLVRLSPRPRPEFLSFYYPEESYYSYQAPADRSSWRLIERVRAAVRKMVLERFDYPVAPLSMSEKFLQPFAHLLFKSRATYGWGDRFPIFVHDGKVLDVGCGSGQYLSQLKLHGWTAFGVEISQKAAAVAKEQFGIDVYCGDLKFAPFADESFDHVHINHALEHFPDPFSILRKVNELLKPGGTIYIEVPNVDSHGGSGRRAVLASLGCTETPIWIHAEFARKSDQRCRPESWEDDDDPGRFSRLGRHL